MFKGMTIGRGNKMVPLYLIFSCFFLCGYFLSLFITLGDSSPHTKKNEQEPPYLIKAGEYLRTLTSLENSLQQKNLLIKELEEKIDAQHCSENDLIYSLVTKKSIPSLVGLLSSYLSNEQLIDIMSNNTPFSKEFLSRIDDLEQFSEKMSDIRLNNYYESKYQIEPDSYSKINFNNEDKFDEYKNYSLDNESSEKTFSHFTLPQHQADEVLVKWYSPESGETVLFKKYDINPNDSNHHIWLENKELKQGLYNVEIFNSNEDLELLSAGQFHNQ
jgi:hypothetical protein